jgi:hypothetical protein
MIASLLSCKIGLHQGPHYSDCSCGPSTYYSLPCEPADLVICFRHEIFSGRCVTRACNKLHITCYRHVCNMSTILLREPADLTMVLNRRKFEHTVCHVCMRQVNYYLQPASYQNVAHMLPRGHHVCTRFPMRQLLCNMMKTTCVFFARLNLIAYGMQSGTTVLNVGMEMASLLWV